MKKKIMLVGALLISLMCTTPVYAKKVVDSCDGFSNYIDVKLPDTVHKIILLIQIAVPIVLVIFGMLDLFKGLTAQKEDEIKKGQQIFVKRLINAAIVFFVILIVKLLIGFVADNDEKSITNCANCFINGVNTSTGICKEWWLVYVKR